MLTVVDLPLKAKELMRNIHKRVSMTYLSMATNKESRVRNTVAIAGNFRLFHPLHALMGEIFITQMFVLC